MDNFYVIQLDSTIWRNIIYCRWNIIFSKYVILDDSCRIICDRDQIIWPVSNKFYIIHLDGTISRMIYCVKAIFGKCVILDDSTRYVDLKQLIQLASNKFYVTQLDFTILVKNISSWKIMKIITEVFIILALIRFSVIVLFWMRAEELDTNFKNVKENLFREISALYSSSLLFLQILIALVTWLLVNLRLSIKTCDCDSANTSMVFILLL